ncbi:hypothetical protein VHEMI10560 [[Torrubiella] hemipterigena]|uniref:Uncharacterized protein n=1 Tax=[Torrubiella] hemipterigena TaxID=1531966 RepID=A0A0A1TTG4_9HYPO|nr:hypothetical protein VHEMI10560 [[Torrubiella] hemipterigena]
MSRLEAPSSPTGLSPTRSGKRHQIKRSLSELASPTRGSRAQSRREPPQDDRHLHLVHSTPITRRSLDTPRFDGSNMAQSPEDSRRPSIFVARDEAAERAASREARQKSLRIEEARVIESSEFVLPMINQRDLDF